MNDSYKIIESDISGKLVADLPDQPDIGADALKAWFDALPRYIIERFNTLANDFVTKEYADDLVIEAGAGDMAKSVYDTDDDGKVDTAESADVAEAVEIGGTEVSGDRMFYSVGAKGSFYNVTLYANGWGDSAPYTQTASITATSSDIVLLDPVYSGETTAKVAMRDAYNCVDFAEVTGANEMTFYCFDTKPTADIVLSVRVVR